MPELPEVETIAADLRPRLIGRTIVRCDLRFPTIVRHPEPETFVDLIAGLRIESVSRRGKYILIGLEADRVLVVHLGMSGQLRLVDASTPIADHTHAIFELEDGRQLRYRDPRRFGRILLGTQPALLEARAIPRLGPEPIDPAFGADDLYALLRRRRAPLKAVLLDQGTVAGVGNIYADESLHRARLRPDRAAGGLSRKSRPRSRTAGARSTRTATRGGRSAGSRRCSWSTVARASRASRAGDHCRANA